MQILQQSLLQDISATFRKQAILMEKCEAVGFTADVGHLTCVSCGISQKGLKSESFCAKKTGMFSNDTRASVLSNQ